MTDEQINAVIGKACGDYLCECCKDICKTCDKNYCNDFNAMKSAEDTLTDEEMGVMVFWLSHICKIGTYWRATARQRAEAFLRTLGKWEEDTK